MLDNLPPKVEHAALLALGGAMRDLDYGFVTPTPATIARVNTRPGAEWARDLRGVFGWSRKFRAELLPRSLFHTMRDAGVAVRDGEGWRSTVRVSSLGGDLFVHSAYPTTAGDAVFFGPDTYRFCDAIRYALADLDVLRAVDVCSGAGPGGVTVARLRRDAEVLLADINDRALDLSRVNAALALLPSVRAEHSDLLSGLDGDFDLIVANPPYIADPARRTYRDGGGDHGAGLSVAILDSALPRLRRGGRLVLYTGVAILDGVDPFLATVTAKLADWGGRWTYREIDPDVFGEELEEPVYADVDRIAAVVLIATKS